MQPRHTKPRALHFLSVHFKKEVSRTFLAEPLTNISPNNDHQLLCVNSEPSLYPELNRKWVANSPEIPSTTDAIYAASSEAEPVRRSQGLSSLNMPR
jgi:hypothetical protein